MLKVIGSMRKITLARDEESMQALRVAASKSGSKLDLEQRGNILFGRAIFLGYDLPNGNGDAIPSFYASTFGPSFIDKHLDFEHKEDEANKIGKIWATWHVENEIPLGEGPRVIGRNAFGRDLDGRAPLFRLLSGQGQPINGALRELQVEGIFGINREHKMGDIVARRLLSGEMDSVSQEASTAYCQCSVCAHKVQFPFDPICDHMGGGSLMVRSWKVDGYDEEVLGYKIHHDPVGTGLGVVQVPAFDRAKVLEMTAALKSGQLNLAAAMALVNEHERMMGSEADRNLIEAARKDFETIGRDLAKASPQYIGGGFEAAGMPGISPERSQEPWLETVLKDSKNDGLSREQFIEKARNYMPVSDKLKDEIAESAGKLWDASSGQGNEVKANFRPGQMMDDPEHPFIVWNNFDGMAAFPNSFATLEEARAAAENKMEGWKAQGYYKTNDGYRVPFDSLKVVELGEGVSPEDQDDAVLVIADDSKPNGFVARRRNVRAFMVRAGFFSWKTSDTGRTLVAVEISEQQYDEGKPVIHEATLLLPGGGRITGEYDGYGRIAGRDIFAEVWADLKGLELTPETLEKVRDEAFASDETYEEVMNAVKIVENPNTDYESVKTSEPAASQGYFFEKPVGDDGDEDADDGGEDDDDVQAAAQPKTPAMALMSAIIEASPVDGDGPEELAAKVHTAAILEARLNRETYAVVRQANLAAALHGLGAVPVEAAVETASRAAAVGAFQAALDGSKSFMASKTSLELPAGTGEGAVPAWTVRHAAEVLASAPCGSPRMTMALAEIDRAMPCVAGFHARLAAARGEASSTPPAQLAAAMADHDELNRRLDAMSKKPGSQVPAEVEKVAARLAASIEALAAEELGQKFSLTAMAAAERALGKSTPAFAARRLRLPTAALGVVTDAAQSGDLGKAVEALKVFASHTENHLGKHEKVAVRILGTKRAKSSADVQEIMLAAAALSFGAGESAMRVAAAAFVAAQEGVGKAVLSFERADARDRALAAAWTRAFDADPSADPAVLASAVAAEAKCGRTLAFRAGVRLQAAGGMWPWTSQGEVGAENWPQFIEARSDEELQKIAGEWEARLATAVGVEARMNIESNVRRLRSVLDARRQARGGSVALVGSADPLGAYWAVKAADGRVALRVPLRRILAGRKDKIAVKWASSARYGEFLAAKVRAFGFGTVEARLFPKAAVERPKTLVKAADEGFIREVAEMILYDGIAKEAEDVDSEFGKIINSRDFVQPQQDIINTVPEALRTAGIDPEPLLKAVEEQMKRHPAELESGDIWQAWAHLSEYGVGGDQVYEALQAYVKKMAPDAGVTAAKAEATTLSDEIQSIFDNQSLQDDGNGNVDAIDALDDLKDEGRIPKDIAVEFDDLVAELSHAAYLWDFTTGTSRTGDSPDLEDVKAKIIDLVSKSEGQPEEAKGGLAKGDWVKEKNPQEGRDGIIYEIESFGSEGTVLDGQVGVRRVNENGKLSQYRNRFPVDSVEKVDKETAKP